MHKISNTMAAKNSFTRKKNRRVITGMTIAVYPGSMVLQSLYSIMILLLLLLTVSQVCAWALFGYEVTNL